MSFYFYFYFFGYLTDKHKPSSSPCSLKSTLFFKGFPCLELNLCSHLEPHNYIECNRYLFWCLWNYPQFFDILCAAVLMSVISVCMYTFFSSVRMCLFFLLMRSGTWFAWSYFKVTQLRRSRGFPSFSCIDGPLGLAQIQSGILICTEFPKTTTEILRGPGIVMAFTVFPRNIWEPGSTF